MDYMVSPRCKTPVNVEEYKLSLIIKSNDYVIFLKDKLAKHTHP